ALKARSLLLARNKRKTRRTSRRVHQFLQPGLEGAVEAQEAGPAVHVASRSIGSDIVDRQLRGEVLDDLVVKRHTCTQNVDLVRTTEVADIAEVLSTDRTLELRREPS